MVVMMLRLCDVQWGGEMIMLDQGQGMKYFILICVVMMDIVYH
jgi:hypothetical protein